MDVTYDEPLTDTVYFNFALTKSYTKTVDLNLADEGIDRGPFGTLDVAALGDATFSVDNGADRASASTWRPGAGVRRRHAAVGPNGVRGRRGVGGHDRGQSRAQQLPIGRKMTFPVIGDGFDAAGTFIGKLAGVVEDFRLAL